MRIPLQLKRSSRVVVQRQATVARGGHQWSWVVEKKVLGFGWVGVWRGGERKIMFFTLKNIFIIYRSYLASSSH